MKFTPIRLFAGAVVLSAAGYGTIVANESYTGSAVIPTKNDRPTVGFGSTFNEDGSPVKLGDTITPPKAIIRSLAHIAKDESAIKACVTGAVSQVEFDLLIDFSYQMGAKTTCNSSVVRHTNAGNYKQACHAYALYKYSGGYDCSTPGNRVCSGVYKRSLEREAACLKAQ